MYLAPSGTLAANQIHKAKPTPHKKVDTLTITRFTITPPKRLPKKSYRYTRETSATKPRQRTCRQMVHTPRSVYNPWIDFLIHSRIHPTDHASRERQETVT